MTAGPGDPADEPDPADAADEELVLASVLGSKRTGVWTVPGRITLRQRAGSSSLDFRAAAFTRAVTTLELDVLSGVVHVWLPEQLTLDTAGARVVIGRLYRHPNAVTPGPTAPALVVTGRIGYGSLNIRQPI